MINLAIAVVLAASPAAMSLKDPPEPPIRSLSQRVDNMPEPGRHPFVYVRGFSQRFYVPEPILRRYKILPATTIEPALARKIASEFGADYRPEELKQLEELDQKDLTQ